MEQLLGRVIVASGSMTILFSMFMGHLHSIELCSTMPKRYQFGLSCNTKFLDMSCTEMEQKDLILLSFLKYRANVQSLLFYMGYRPPYREQ